MTPDTEHSQDPVQKTEAVMDDAADAARATARDASANLASGTSAMADAAEKANQDGAEAAGKASRATTEAFGMARERLNAMADGMPGPAQEMLRPLRSGSEALGRGLESSYASTVEGMAEFNSKAIAAWRSNAESTIQHWQNLAAVKSFSEAIALSAEHTRKQLEAVTTQTRELSALATKIVRGAADPVKFGGR